MIALFFVAIYTNTNAQVYIWGGPGDKNSEFDGGLNDWTTEGFTADAGCANPVPDNSKEWEWSANAATKGAFSGSNGQPVIASPSVNNGVAMYDSDFKDNGGNGNNTSTKRQLAYLTSPKFSCKGHKSVVVRFNHRKFNFATGFYLEVSSDDGVSWEEYDLNKDDFAVNRISHSREFNGADDFEVVDISKSAAEKDSVQIRFKICGYYYFWIIDDVYVMEQVEDNIVLGDCFYPSTNYARPAMSLSSDTAFFSCYVANVGTADNDSINLVAGILNADDGSVLFSTSKTISLASGDTTRVDFDDYYLTKDLPSDQVYGIVYRIVNDDYNPTDNIYAQGMVINDNTDYQKIDRELRANSGYRPRAAESFAFGLPFQTGATGKDYIVKSVETGIVGNGNAMQEPDNVVEAYLLEFTDNDPYFNQEGFSDFSFDAIDAENDYYKVVGYGVKPVTDNDVENWSLFTIPMENDLDPDKPLRLKPDKLYVMAINVVQSTGDNIYVLFRLSNLEMHNYETIFPKAQLSYLTFTDSWAGAFTNVQNPPYCAIDLEFSPDNATKQLELPKDAVSISPNPATDKFIVEYSFKEATSGELVLTTNDGKVISRRPLQNTQSGKQTYQTSNLSSGQYQMNVKTKLGVKTISVIVQK